jgi:hypothetical protein
VHAAVSEIELFKNWVFFPRSENFLFTSLILLNMVKNTRPMRKVVGNELEVYLFSFKLRSAGPMLPSRVAYNRKPRKMEFGKNK